MDQRIRAHRRRSETRFQCEVARFSAVLQPHHHIDTRHPGNDQSSIRRIENCSIQQQAETRYSRSPAKAGVQAASRCRHWTPAFAGEQDGTRRAGFPAVPVHPIEEVETRIQCKVPQFSATFRKGFIAAWRIPVPPRQSQLRRRASDKCRQSHRRSGCRSRRSCWGRIASRRRSRRPSAHRLPSHAHRCR